MTTLRQLRTVSLLGRTLSFTKTAELMAVTQSAVSVTIRELESELGLPLVVRGRALRLTTAGEALAECANRCQGDLERTLDTIRVGSNGRQGRLHIAVAHVSAATFLPSALALFQNRHPHVQVRITDCPVERVSQLVSTGDADAGIGALDADPAMGSLLKAAVLVRDRLWAVRRSTERGGRSAGRPTPLHWRKLQGAPLLLVGRVQGQWRNLFVRLDEAEIRFKISQEVSLFATAIEMVRSGLGVALLPGFVARHVDPDLYLAQPMIQPVTEWQVHWLLRRNMPASATADEMLKAVKETLESDWAGP